MFAYFFYIWYFEYGLILYEKIPNSFLFYSICAAFILLFNLLIGKVKIPFIILFNFSFIVLVFSVFVYPYIKGEKIHKDIECGKEIIKTINEYKVRHNGLPKSSIDIDNSECAGKIKYEYEFVSMKEYNENHKKFYDASDTLTEDSFYLRIFIEEYKPLNILYSNKRKIFLLED